MKEPDSWPAPARDRPAWDYLEECGDRMAAELAARGLVVDAGGYVQDLCEVRCEVTPLTTGAVVINYVPLGDCSMSAVEAARVVLAMLTARTRQWPAAGPGLTFHEAVAWLLRDAGLSARVAVVRWADGELCPEVVATSHDDPPRGSVRVIGDTEILHECQFAAPGRPRLTPAQVADALAAALTWARTPTEQETRVR